MKLALVAGAWSSNIGNAFFNLGAEWLLRDIGCNVTFFPESPRWKENVQSHFDAVARLGCDLVVLNGPCLNERLAYVYQDTFKTLYARGIKAAYLSAGMARYDQEEVRSVVQFFEQFPPCFICTRDRQTVELLDRFAGCAIYNGLCTSMFLNDAIHPAPIADEPYLVLNFDGDHEPELSFAADQTATVTNRSVARFPKYLQGLKVVRTSNLSIDEGYHKIYRKPNTYHSDLPQGYCAILKHADVVYSERVHTCAAALAYGTKVQFIPQSGRSFEKRSQLFERVGVSDIQKHPVSLNFDFINSEKNGMKKFLKSLLM